MDHIIVGPGNEFYSFQEKNQMPLASLKLTKDLEDIELEGFRVAENTAVKEENQICDGENLGTASGAEQGIVF